MIYILYVLGIFALLVGSVVVIALLRPSDFRVTRSQSISASPTRLFPYISNLKRFQEWNPYKDKDPNARNEFSGPEEGPGAIFRWDGNKNVGAGSMTIQNQVQDKHVDIDLSFVRPFPGRNTVKFALEPQTDSTLVTWSMHGKFALIPKIVGLFLNMDRMIGGDFEIGLQRLKSLMENDNAQPLRQ